MYCVSDNEIQNNLTERQFLGLRSNIVDPKYKIFFQENIVHLSITH